MDLHSMIDVIESSGELNAWRLIEAELNPISRFKLRNTFFQALKDLNIHFDMLKDNWEES
jgi:hypothetical protein